MAWFANVCVCECVCEWVCEWVCVCVCECKCARVLKRNVEGIMKKVFLYANKGNMDFLILIFCIICGYRRFGETGDPAFRMKRLYPLILWHRVVNDNDHNRPHKILNSIVEVGHTIRRALLFSPVTTNAPILHTHSFSHLSPTLCNHSNGRRC